MLKKTLKTVIMGVIILALAFTFIGCDIANRTPGTTTGGTTTPRITTGTTRTTTPGITTGTTTTGNITTGTITGTGNTTTTRGRAIIPGNRPGNNMPRTNGNGAINGADRGGMLFGSAPDLFFRSDMVQNGYTNGLTGNNGYPYGNPTGHFKSGYPEGYNNEYTPVDGNERAGQVADYGRLPRTRRFAPGFLGSFRNTPGVNIYDSNAVMNRIAKNNELCDVADIIKKDVKGMKEIRDAEVCATEDSVFIGIKPGIYADDMNSLKNNVQDKVKTKFPQVEFVHVTDDNLDMQSIRRAYGKMKNSNLEPHRLNEILQVVRDNVAIGSNL
ncbi:MAG TPA: hypothetical protein DDZ89_01490 [Clostridiales bacterium]|nr:hypothetical protein [Clostridiales bacterium]